MIRANETMPLLLALAVAASACSSSTQIKATAPPSALLQRGDGKTSQADPAAVTRSDAEVKKTRGSAGPLFQVRLIPQAAGRTVRAPGEAAVH